MHKFNGESKTRRKCVFDSLRRRNLQSRYIMEFPPGFYSGVRRNVTSALVLCIEPSPRCSDMMPQYHRQGIKHKYCLPVATPLASPPHPPAIAPTMGVPTRHRVPAKKPFAILLLPLDRPALTSRGFRVLKMELKALKSTSCVPSSVLSWVEPPPNENLCWC